MTYPLLDQGIVAFYPPKFGQPLEHGFYWQRQSLGLLNGHDTPMTVSDMLDLYFSGFSADPERYDKWQKDRRDQWVHDKGWTPLEWVSLLEQLTYKPGWHVELIIDMDKGLISELPRWTPTLALNFWAIVDMPDTQAQLGVKVPIYDSWVRDEKRAMYLIRHALDTMEDQISVGWLRVSGHPYVKEK